MRLTALTVFSIALGGCVGGGASGGSDCRIEGFNCTAGFVCAENQFGGWACRAAGDGTDGSTSGGGDASGPRDDDGAPPSMQADADLGGMPVGGAGGGEPTGGSGGGGGEPLGGTGGDDGCDACLQFAECATSDDPGEREDLCPNLDGGDFESVYESCLPSCDVVGQLVAEIGGCGPLVGVFRQLDEGFDTQCGDGPDQPDNRPLPRQNQWGPAGRLSNLEVPSGPRQGGELGCRLPSRQGGSGLGTLLSLTGGRPADLVQPGEDGLVPVIVIGRVAGWREGQRVSQIRGAQFEWYDGGGYPGDWYVEYESFPGHNPHATPLYVAEDVEIDPSGHMDAGPSDYAMPMRIGDADVQIPLAFVYLRGRLFVDGPGFGVRNGVVEGYLSRDALVEVVSSLQTTCTGERPPTICDALGPLLQPGVPPEELVERLLPIVGGFDARRRGGEWEACEGEGCDHLGVCFGVEFEGIEATLEI